MKLLGTFDTKNKEKEYDKAVKKYGEENVLLITRDRIFFLFFILAPLLGLLFVGIAFMVLAFSTKSGILNWILGILFLIIFLPSGYKILKKYFDYNLDFAIIAPDGIQSFNQTGFFKITSKQLSSDQIEQVKTVQSGMLNSIFNYGTVSILTDSNAAGAEADISLKYMTNPRELESEIRAINKTEVEIALEDRQEEKRKKKDEKDENESQIKSKKYKNPKNINWSRKSDKFLSDTTKKIL